MLPLGAARDSRAPYNQEDIEYVCRNCRKPTNVNSDDMFTCNYCKQYVQSVSTEELKKEEYEDAMERKAEEIRERRRFNNA